MWNVSRSTVREAVRTLQEAGLVSTHGRRYRVVAPATDAGAVHRAAARDAAPQGQLRGTLRGAARVEPPLARLAATRASEDDLRSLMQSLQAQERHMEDIETWSALDEQFHTAIAKATKNPALLVARIRWARALYLLCRPT